MNAIFKGDYYCVSNFNTTVKLDATDAFFRINTAFMFEPFLLFMNESQNCEKQIALLTFKNQNFLKM